MLVHEWVSTLSKDPYNPAPGLSCSNCPNPVFTGDSSQVYTVRIWNTDSCSVVRPVRVTVRQPKSNFSTSPSDCILPTGGIQVQADTSVWHHWQSWQAVSMAGDTTFGVGNAISGLAYGKYAVTIVGEKGCKSAIDTVVILPYNNTVASFAASPLSGTPPFTVSIQNTSANANQYEWFVNGIPQGASLPQYKIDTSGSYTILLVASQNGICRDTVGEIIQAKGNVFLFIPQFITPNNDGKNDTWTISGLSKFPHNSVSIFNRWGNVVYSKENYQNDWNGTPNVDTTIGKGKLPNGTYFYVVKVKKPNGKAAVFKGYLEVER